MVTVIKYVPWLVLFLLTFTDVLILLISYQLALKVKFYNLLTIFKINLLLPNICIISQLIFININFLSIKMIFIKYLLSFPIHQMILI